MLNTIDKCDKVIWKLRTGERGVFCNDDKIADHASRVLGKVLDRRAKLYGQAKRYVGPYSGLTRQELARTGTCETDWY